MQLGFEQGRLIIKGDVPESFIAEQGLKWDPRALVHSALAMRYRDVLLGNNEIEDAARSYQKLELSLAKPIVPRKHQSEALSAWLKQDARGVVSLPTGAGKTILAVMAIAKINRSTLIVVPTIDLMMQWQKVLTEFFDAPIGALGGGEKEITDITVATYDSAAMQIPYIGNRFGFLICDECHHLPAPQYQNIARCSIAPFRLGLSATVERADGKEATIYDCLGDLVYTAQIQSMVSKVLAPYEVVSIEVPLTAEEQEAYKTARGIYTDFLRRAGVNFNHPNGWQQFLIKATRMPGGRAAMQAYREQKRLAQAASMKIEELWEILQNHKEDQVLVFTDDNKFAYEIGRSFLLPVLTHKTKLKERKRILKEFSEKKINTIVTSKVLNEGVDVPEARIGIVVSGSGAVREHVQRLGRILRHQPGKKAILYELIAKGTNEQGVNKRRKKHDAYQATSEIH